MSRAPRRDVAASIVQVAGGQIQKLFSSDPFPLNGGPDVLKAAGNIRRPSGAVEAAARLRLIERVCYMSRRDTQPRLRSFRGVSKRGRSTAVALKSSVLSRQTLLAGTSALALMWAMPVAHARPLGYSAF